MRKALRNSNLMAFALVATLAAFGCTTNRTHGEGEPYMGAPSVGPMSPTSNTGGTSVPTTPPPMTSSYRGNEQALVTRPHRLTPDEAASIMASHSPKVRVLGPVDPGPGRPYASDGVVTGQVLNYASVNPQMTVNSTLNSPATPAITSGADQNGAAAAPVFSPTVATPTTAAIAVTPTSAASSAMTTTAGTTIATTGTAATPTTASANAPVTAASTTLNTNATSNSSVRVTTTNGRVTVTNATTSNSRSQ
jgi:hypothetical protein